MAATVTTKKTGDSTASLSAGKYLTFKLGAESYGLAILKVQEIIGLMAITQVPKAPHFMRGIINLRGRVIAVVDSRLKFDMDVREDTERTCVIVVQVRLAGQEITMGLIVDEVSEVLDIPGNLIEPPPAFGQDVNTDFILGIGKVGGKVIMLLDVDRVLSGGDAVLLENVVHT